MRQASAGLALTLLAASATTDAQEVKWTSGLGRRFFDSDTTKLTTQIGFGYRSLSSVT